MKASKSVRDKANFSLYNFFDHHSKASTKWLNNPGCRIGLLQFEQQDAANLNFSNISITNAFN